MPTKYTKSEGKLNFYSHYKVKEIKPGHVLQLMYKKTESRWSYSLIVEVEKISEDSGMMTGISLFDSGAFLFHVKHVYRDYTLDPITSRSPGEKYKSNLIFKRKVGV